MKTQTRPQPRSQRTPQRPVPPAAVPARPWEAAWWMYALGALASFLLALWIYQPSLNGQFVFDDLHLPFNQPGAIFAPLSSWLHVRPVTMLSYWANLHWVGPEPFSFHLWNIAFHTAAAFPLFFVLRRLLELAETAEPARTTFALFGAALFLLHPIQSEGVAYVAGRSEAISAFFYFAAWMAFLYRRTSAISWPAAAGVLLLFGAAVGSKEHTPTLPAVLLLTDYFFNPGFSWSGARRNWKLYVPILVLGLIGVVVILRVIGRDTISVGFNLEEFTWYQYLFTQFRVFFAYLGLFLFPYWQTIDYDFAVSHTLFEHGAIFYLLGIVALAALAFRCRRRFPLASFGFFLFVVILAPTSSFIPLKDVMADRRMYLPLVGLILISLEFLRRWNINRKTLIALMGGLCLVFAVWSHERSTVWRSSLSLWEDAARKGPNKQRVQFGLAVADFQANRCPAAIDHYARAAAIQKPDYMVLMDWGMAYECNGQHAEALQKLHQSVDLHSSAQAWANIALIGFKQGKIDEPLAELDKAEALDPGMITVYLYRATVMEAMNRLPVAEANYRHVLNLNSANRSAIEGLARVQAAMRAAAR